MNYLTIFLHADRPITKFFNFHKKLYKELNLKEELSMMREQDAIALLVNHPELIVHPLLILKHQTLIGFKESDWRNALSLPPHDTIY
jgi:arsenate reductase